MLITPNLLFCYNMLQVRMTFVLIMEVNNGSKQPNSPKFESMYAFYLPSIIRKIKRFY